MPLTLPLPDWVPWWGQLAILVVAILFGFAFLMMPFAVFGLKGRLDFLEAQLDDIHAELRMMATRLPDAERSPARAVAREPVAEEVPRARPLREPSPPARVGQAPTLPMSRRPPESEEWPRTPAVRDGGDPDETPRRPLRAMPLRDIERDRSEPTLRWPPR